MASERWQLKSDTIAWLLGIIFAAGVVYSKTQDIPQMREDIQSLKIVSAERDVDIKYIKAAVDDIRKAVK